MIPIISTVPMGFSVARLCSTPRWRLRAVVVGVAIACGAGGCGGDSASGDSQIPSAVETKKLLLELPYRYEFRTVKGPAGASAAVGGRVFGRHSTWFDFGVSLGSNSPKPVPVPRGGAEVVGNPGFVFSTNVLVRGENGQFKAGEQLRTRAQWRESGHMATEMEQALCRAITGRPCPV